MKKEYVLYSALGSIVIGMGLIGLGLGKIAMKPYVGILIGLGSGLFIAALPLLSIFRRMDAYEKK